MKTQDSKNIEAQAIGISIPSSSWEGKVISIFPKAINFLHPKGIFVSLVQEPSQMSSMSILAPEYFRVKLSGGWNNLEEIRIGMKIFYSKKKLVIGDFSLNLLNGQTWDGSLSSDAVESFSFQKLLPFRKALLLVGKEEGFIGIMRSGAKINQFLKKYFSILERVQVFNFKDNEVTLSGLSSLVGLGIGLTPSGDDFLTGALLGERMLTHLLVSNQEKVKRQTEKTCYLRVEKKEILASLVKTTTAGRTLLWQALRGQFPAFLLKLANRITKSSGFEDMMGGLQEATSHGETSGTDASVGLFWFLSYFKEMEI
jgi:hypothetical protein